MKKRLSIIIALVILVISAAACTPKAPRLRAGIRASSYGITPFPSPDWWLASTDSMAKNFDDADPAVVWIVATVQHKGYTWLNFPMPEGKKSSDFEKILFTPLDDNEAYLNEFDKKGVKVWLQVEPNEADIETLIDLVLKRYAQHPCIVGFGIDVEWYQHKIYDEGKPVSDEEAKAWLEKVRSYNPEYKLFLKHWLSEKMPPTYREGMMFLDDSQGYTSLEEMTADFSNWGTFFDPAPVGFQFGYRADRKWWRNFDNPPAEIGKALIAAIPNTSDLVWVDFTAKEIWKQEK